MFPFSFWTSTSEFESRLQSTEAKLLEFVQRNNNDIEVKAFDTSIPRSAVPCLEPAKAEEDETLKIHCVQAVSNGFKNGTLENENPPLPLVNLHGYMNAGAILYRNLEGLCSFFPRVYAVDMLGWGLSSRPSWNEVKDNGSVQSAEDFFVESLEAWRSMNDIDKMVLSGHSFGGYVAVAYTERYPERVDRLILLSPIGVPDPPDLNSQSNAYTSLRRQIFFGIFRNMFEWTTPGGFIRGFTEYRGATMVKSYIERRLPEITDVEESKTLADFLYLNSVLPGSGECFLRSLFTSSIFSKNPLLFRIPNLKVKSVDFMYGSSDWMDVSGGMNTQSLCHRLSQEQDGSSPSLSTPDVNVFLVPNAGHLLILQNPEVVNACMIRIAGGTVGVPEENMPALMDLDKKKDLDVSWLRRARESSKQRQKDILG